MIRGRVQGVWFRDSMRQVAEDAGVVGWVRNRADGAVESEVEGDADALRRVVLWAEDGPPRAEVTSVETTDVEATGGTHFEVR